ncbi:hypothetical protein C3F34_19985 (plasmid) [Acinetobacter sp. ACNIH2]|uniref:hypothetical protein n=1 Tax=Acinetobacter sp. ACNIH2 TaxID=1758189 RepID=UPI000CDC541E|nr:hypothetical protein [Acinetobacter sp. ACNIH2]AUX86884.1 hypothetical protein C3F34_13115 [Acinetobacter sp. ACNIH2]AUX88332.1 hypothetical protein C3F34_19985 [Acinetobacter sp. ACNIH2]
MTAIEFVQKFGWGASQYWTGRFNAVNEVEEKFINTQFRDDLKKYIDAYELVQKFGGLEEAKDEYFSCIQNNENGSHISEAITLVESVESLKEVT